MTHDLLAGIRVLDFTLAAVGPFCTRVLSDLGAEVIHVEWPRVRWQSAQSGLEDTRFTREGMGLDGGRGRRDQQLYAHTNAGKKSLAVNLKTPQGVAAVRKLVERVDVVVENMTPRVMQGYGLSYASLRETNPRLVMCSMSGFGQQGLDGDTARPCSDPVAQAMSGIAWSTGERDGPPYTVGGGLGDTVTSMTGATAILAALLRRDRTGEGEYIDLSMVESLAYLDCTVLPYAAMTGHNHYFRNGQQNSYTFPMGPFRATGGYIALQAPGSGADSPWGRLCLLMDREDLLADERLVDDVSRLEHADEVIAAVETWLCSMEDREGALALLASERISAGPVLSQEEMLTHPFFAERGTFGTVDYPEFGPVRMVEPPFKLERSSAHVRGPAPQMGEHTREIAGADLGLGEDEVQDLIDAGVLYESKGARRRRDAAVVTGTDHSAVLPSATPRSSTGVN
jgi:CoA:oxalate CoA-transferase